MSLQYLLDGYNLIHQIQDLIQLKLEDQRKYLVRLVQSRRPQGSIKNAVTIVFDGKPGMVGGMDASQVRIIFAQNESADEKIKEIVRQAANKSAIIVVTDDRGLQYSVRSMGAKIISVKEFLGKAVEKSRPSGPAKALKPDNEPKKNISKTLEFRITSEFEKIWLIDKDP